MSQRPTGGYSIRKLKTWTGRDGYGYAGELLRDGKLIGEFLQSGNGGHTHLIFQQKTDGKTNRDKVEEELFNDFLATLPEETWPEDWTTTDTGTTYKVDADGFIAGLVDDHESDKKLRRLCAKKTVYRLKSDTPEELWTIPHPFDLEMKAGLQAKHGDQLAEIINERFLK